MKYRDGLGHEYEVPEHLVPEFERKRNTLLRIKIIVQVIVIIGLLWLIGR